MEIAISREQPRSTSSAVVQVGGASSANVAIASNLETSSDFRLKETYASLSLNDQLLEIPAPLQYSRDLYVTYLDDDLLVVRDESGVPEILLRKAGVFTSSEGEEGSGRTRRALETKPGTTPPHPGTAEPSSADDDTAPGAG